MAVATKNDETQPATLVASPEEDDDIYPGDTVSPELPAWFTKRMMNDEWFFGLLLVTGDIVAISHIDEITVGCDGTIWLKVNLLDASYEGLCIRNGKTASRLMLAPTTRTTASINASHVVCAFELADT